MYGILREPDETFNEVFHFEHEKSLFQALESLDRKNTFIYCHFWDSLEKGDARTLRIYRFIDRLRIPYGVGITGLGDIPGERELLPLAEPPGVGPIHKRMIRRLAGRWIDAWRRGGIKGIFTLIQIPPSLRQHPAVFLYRRGLLRLQGPLFWVSRGPNATLMQYPTAFPVGKRTKILWTHMPLYDDVIDENGEARRDPVAAFFGQSLPFIEQYGVAVTLEPRHYYALLHNLFRFIEKRFGYQVIKTTHPDGSPERIREYLPDYPPQTQNSVSLARTASLILGHDSTSLCYAVLYQKPVVILITDEYERLPAERDATYGLALSLGKKPINLDRTSPEQIDWESEMRVDEEVYSAFVRRYIKKPGTPERKTWEIVFDEVESVIGQQGRF